MKCLLSESDDKLNFVKISHTLGTVTFKNRSKVNNIRTSLRAYRDASLAWVKFQESELNASRARVMTILILSKF